ncbi:hypothetical protein SPRG_08401 [Saprolegnia parasitica CBS 223.65]|uniref:Uncharacterized protein n=1 Tax=Saprolegnia parasitica (strain CBS 223.65) TaxID=695850 RepID=A0A067C755_SAPPC|nr:hypothetical protein SPRG_08401 [Saprolegnia parasitica CBS 223.65]KDO26328.1 hypothetical protein SPRG_08401 [Saprolegnia parasitica CBS 223.65]|eukprot:XP_012203027.1 hypothetical protein SPRG_08401 [Saprolegnia parasitica CBS 223.65]
MLAVSISPSPPLKKVHFDVDIEAELFQPTHTVCTPKLRTNGLKYRAPGARMDVSETLAPPSSVAKPNYDDSLRRVAVVLYQHIRRCEKRLRETAPLLMSTIQSATIAETPVAEASQHHALRTESFDASTVHPTSGHLPGLHLSLDKVFDEEHFVSPTYKYTFVRLPTLHPLSYYRMDKVNCKTHIPSVEEIFRFCKNLFNRAQLSAECTIVCLIYIERLMERANIPLLGSSWKPIVLCGLLLASKVWQDLSSWNVEISNIYPQFPLHCINRLERLFLHYIQWDLYISGSVYAKYYFALRSLTEKKTFDAERSAAVKNELYSRSL